MITGAGGMLGQYICEQFNDSSVKTLGLRDSSDFRVNLTSEMPDFSGERFSSVIHCAGTEEDKDAMSLNYEGTKRLLAALETIPPENFVFISSYRVYSRDAGEDLVEETNSWASDETGRSKALAEDLVKKWCEEKGVTLTIIRPARMFGNGVKGDSLILFNDAISGKYIHIRGNDARISLVTALDVARAIKKIHKSGGLYNAADGMNPRFIEMVEAMSANNGAKKRMTHLPAAWAEWLWRLFRWIPSIERNLSPAVVESRMKTLTLNGSRLAERAGIAYHDTIKVIDHTDSSYPYSFNRPRKEEIIHEV